MVNGAAVTGGRGSPSTEKTTSVTPMSSDTLALTLTSWPGSARLGASSVITGASRSLSVAGNTVTTTAALPTSSPSVAVSSRTYRPGMAKLTLELAAAGVAKVTAPGPRARLQVVETFDPDGRPSSVTDAVTTSGVPMTARRSSPTETRGAAFSGGAAETSTATSADDVSSPSLAVARS